MRDENEAAEPRHADAQVLFEAQLRTYAMQLSTRWLSVRRAHWSPKLTSKEALALITDRAAAISGEVTIFVNLIGRVLSNTSMVLPGRPRGNPRDVPEFGSDGFRDDFQDDSNQVRHFAAAFVVGATRGSAVGTYLNTGREIWSLLGGQGGASMADVYLGNKAAQHGGMIARGHIKPDRLGGCIRLEF
jgi:hypothetical protein